jgi:AcrR family transcriptional regulator
MADLTFQRARRPAQKERRRAEILAAARRLAVADRVGNVTLKAIAAEVGLAHSNVLAYFETREDIYLHITADEWENWVSALRAEAATVGGDPGLLAALLVRTLTERPLLCDLLGHTPIHLEHHVSTTAARQYKLSVLASVDAAAKVCAQALPHIGDTAAFEMIAATTLLAGSLWQVAHPPAALADLYATDPDLAAGCIEFEPTLTRLATATVLGIASAATGSRS